jgi:hypothetical protein
VPFASRRPIIAISVPVVAIAALAGLAACEKPPPGATVFSETTSAHREAFCWSFDADREFDADADCSIKLESTEQFNSELLAKVPVIDTAPGETVGISVDPVVAENGWLVSINGRPLTREPVTEKYFRFTMPPLRQGKGGTELVLQALTESGDAIRGSWVFGLDSKAG